MLGSVQNRMGLAAVQGDPAPCALGKGGGNSDCVARRIRTPPDAPLENLGCLGGAIQEFLRANVMNEWIRQYTANLQAEHLRAPAVWRNIRVKQSLLIYIWIAVKLAASLYTMDMHDIVWFTAGTIMSYTRPISLLSKISTFCAVSLIVTRPTQGISCFK